MENQPINQGNNNETPLAPDTSPPPPPQGQVINPGQTANPSQTSQPFQPDRAPAPGLVSASEVTKKRGLKGKLGKKGLIIIALIVLLAGSAGAYFGIILPNKPENIWKKALSNTAKGYDKFVNYADENKDMKGIKAKGNIKLQGQITGDANIDAASYEGQSRLNFDVGFAGQRYKLEALTITPESSSTPDIYLRVNGLKALDSLLSGGRQTDGVFSSLDNQWIFVDHTLFEQTVNQGGGMNVELTKDDILAAARAIGEANHSNLFSSNPDTAVFKIVKQVGREDRDGRDTYHFKVGLNKENLKKYFEALKDGLGETKVKEFAGEDNFNNYFDEWIKDIEQEDISDDDTVDVWIDMDTKMIRFIRFTSEDNANDYMELGLLYDGGDDYPFVVNANIVSEPATKGQVKFTLNTRADTAKVEFNFDEPTGISGEINVEPNNEALNIERPSGAKSITEVLSLFFGGVLGDSTGELPASNPLLDLSVLNQLET